MNAKDAVVKRFWELCEKDNISFKNIFVILNIPTA